MLCATKTLLPWHNACCNISRTALHRRESSPWLSNIHMPLYSKRKPLLNRAPMSLCFASTLFQTSDTLLDESSLHPSRCPPSSYFQIFFIFTFFAGVFSYWTVGYATANVVSSYVTKEKQKKLQRIHTPHGFPLPQAGPPCSNASHTDPPIHQQYHRIGKRAFDSIGRS